MERTNSSASDWFQAAVRWYHEEHQACPRCKDRHCVFRSRWGARLEYHCTICDFSAARDEATGEAAVILGQKERAFFLQR